MSAARGEDAGGKAAAAKIDAHLKDLDDWRGDTLTRVRRLIHEAVPDVEETWKYRGLPVWNADGVICTGQVHQEHVKLTFPTGAAVDDPVGLFNGTKGGSTWRAIDLREDDTLNARSFKALVKRVVRANRSGD